MTAEEYFGDWIKVIDKGELSRVMRRLSSIDKNSLCPAKNNIFKAFRLCSLKDCKVIMLGQDLYPQEGIATGILFGNSADTPEDLLSPSLKVVKEAAINYEIPHSRVEFDNTLESWAKQGILMINSALTCEVGKVGLHSELWKPFISKLLYNVSSRDNGIVYVLFGGQAQAFRSNIVSSLKIIETYHPAFHSRRGSKMSYSIFTDINKVLKSQYNYQINFYKEVDYGIC